MKKNVNYSSNKLLFSLPIKMRKQFIIKFVEEKQEKYTSMLEKGLHKCG